MNTLISGIGPASSRRNSRSKRHDVICEGNHCVRSLVSEEEYDQAYRLRYRIFSEELRWVLQSQNDKEMDEYDDYAVSFGVFDGKRRLISYLRLIMPGRQFMMEKEFLSLVDPGHRVRKGPDTAEISRLCVAPEARTEKSEGNFGIHQISLLLFKGVYHWCLHNAVRYLYAVTEVKVFRLYCAKGFPYRAIGKPAEMPDGATVVAVILDWKEFEQLNSVKRPQLLEWFTGNPSVCSLKQWQPHGLCSMR